MNFAEGWKLYIYPIFLARLRVIVKIYIFCLSSRTSVGGTAVARIISCVVMFVGCYDAATLVVSSTGVLVYKGFV